MNITDDHAAEACVPALDPGGDDLTLFVEGDTLYGAMLDAIRFAEHSICLEMYILADDPIGRCFVAAFVERAENGVRTRLHLDAVGCSSWISRSLVRDLTAGGVELRWFHRWSWRHPRQYGRRNHRKLLVVDGRQAFVGGFNIHRENSRASYGERRWRDTHVRFGGTLAAGAQRLFDQFWDRQTAAEPRNTSDATTTLFPNHTRSCRRRLRCLFDDAFTQAQSTISVTTPYFVPEPRLQEALESSARRGIHTRVLLPRKRDVPLVSFAAEATYASLLAAGVRLYEYQPRMLHAKTAVVDGTWATVGTANFDYRSIFLNCELNLITRDAAFSRRLQDVFDVDQTSR